jgi:hypothetical protein
MACSWHATLAWSRVSLMVCPLALPGRTVTEQPLTSAACATACAARMRSASSPGSKRSKIAREEEQRAGFRHLIGERG